MRDWIKVNRRPAIALLVIAAPFARDLIRSRSAGETFFDATWIIWCVGFMVWFVVHPLTVATASTAAGQTESLADSDLRTIKVDGTTTRRGDLDPVEQARLRFRVREEDASPAPAPAPSEQSRS